MSPCCIWLVWAVCGVSLSLPGWTQALHCWHCGQYSDGVGSITPCTNTSGAELLACQPQHSRCIKYVSDLTTVRDCAPSCVEKEWWGARTYCCHTDGCNSASQITSVMHLLTVTVTVTITVVFVTARLQH